MTEKSKMRRLSIVLMAVCSLVLMSCKEKKTSTVIIAPKPVEEVKKDPSKMQEINQDMNVEWIGKTYPVVIRRVSDESLPMVKDESGSKYYDNVITLKVIRPDGSEFFSRTFKKTDFSSYLDDKTRSNGALLGIVLDRAEGDNLIFAASVGSPDRLSDEYIPMVLTLSRMGNVSIKKDTELDTASDRTEGELTEEEDDGV